MADVRSLPPTGLGSSKLKEFLSLVGNIVMADEDSVLGGVNYTEFGGRYGDTADGVAQGGKTSMVFEAGAIEEGLHQRDAAA